MPQPLDMKALRRQAEIGQGDEVVPVSRNWLRRVVMELDQQRRPIMDYVPVPEARSA